MHWNVFIEYYNSQPSNKTSNLHSKKEGKSKTEVNEKSDSTAKLPTFAEMLVNSQNFSHVEWKKIK